MISPVIGFTTRPRSTGTARMLPSSCRPPACLKSASRGSSHAMRSASGGGVKKLSRSGSSRFERKRRPSALREAISNDTLASVTLREIAR